MKPCLIVHGADNFIGARLAANAADDGWTVLPLRGNDQSAIRQTIRTAQAVAHCIVGSAEHIARSAESLYGLMDAAAATPRVVHLSSMSVYGSANGLVDEASELRADLGPYSTAQRNAELRATAASAPVILRVGVEYGPGCEAWSGRVARWLRSYRVGDLGEFGDGVCNLVYIDDLVAVLRTALLEPNIEGQVFNVAARDKGTWNDYLVAYAIALGAVPVRRIGARRLTFETRVAAPLLKVAELFARASQLRALRTPPPIPPSFLRLCRQDLDLSVVRLEEKLRPQWTPLAEGLRRTALTYG